MNPGRTDNTKKAAAPFTNYQFDFGLGTGARAQAGGFTLKEQKTSGNSSSASGRTSSYTSPVSTGGSWAFQSASASTGNVSKPLQGFGSWTQAGSVWQTGQQTQSMVGDITGKSWAKAEIGGSRAGSGGNIGVVGGVGASKADMFGDLLGGTPFSRSSAAGSLKSSSSLKSSFSLAGLGSSLPKGGASMKESMRSNSVPAPASSSMDPPGSSSGFAAPSGLPDADEFGDFFGHAAKSTKSFPFSSSSQKSQGQPIKADAFDSLKGKGNASADTLNSTRIFGQGMKQPTGAAAGDDFFGVNFTPDLSSHSSSKPANPPYPSQSHDFLSDIFGSGSSASSDPIGSIFGSQKPSVVKISQDPLEALWSRSEKAAPTRHQAQPVPAEDNWNVDGFGVGIKEETTTELEELPPPPAGINGQIAQNKGSEFYKQGQFPDAIKWLTWAVVLCESEGGANLGGILGCRASCYKEVGEYKKAVADCCKVLELNPSDTEILMQRAFLYENMEKYKLGVADLREVLKKDPSNRLASNTLSRLIKMAENS